MSECTNINCERKFKVAFVMITFLLFVACSNLIFFIYSSQFRNYQEIIPEERWKTFDNRNRNLNQQGGKHHIQKRETTSDDEREREDDWGNSTESSSEMEDNVELKGYFKKSNLEEYCFVADDFCRRNYFNISKKPDESEENWEEIIEKSNKDCRLINVETKGEATFRPGIKWGLAIDPFESPKELSIWKKNRCTDHIWVEEYKYDSNFANYTEDRKIDLPSDEISFEGYTVYNGSYYEINRASQTIVKFDLMTKNVMEKKLDDTLSDIIYTGVFRSDYDCLWILYYNSTEKYSVAIQIDPQTLEVLSVKTHIEYIAASFPYFPDIFIAFGRLYKVLPSQSNTSNTTTDNLGKIHCVTDLFGRDDRDFVVTYVVPSDKFFVTCNWRSKFLYILSDYNLFRYKLYFKCRTNQ